MKTGRNTKAGAVKGFRYLCLSIGVLFLGMPAPHFVRSESARLSQGGLLAAPVPGYSQVLKRLPLLWSTRYPVKVHRFVPNPERLGVLTALHKGRRVYYYHFIAIVYRPLRQSDGRISRAAKARRVELWVRYRPWQRPESQWDLSFARRDLLPGKYKRYR